MDFSFQEFVDYFSFHDYLQPYWKHLWSVDRTCTWSLSMSTAVRTVYLIEWAIRNFIQENELLSMMLHFTLDYLKWVTDDNWCLNILVWHENILSIACTRSTTILSTKHFLCVFFFSPLSLLLALNRVLWSIYVSITHHVLLMLSQHTKQLREQMNKGVRIWFERRQKKKRNTIKKKQQI